MTAASQLQKKAIQPGKPAAMIAMIRTGRGHVLQLSPAMISAGVMCDDQDHRPENIRTAAKRPGVNFGAKSDVKTF